MTRVLIVDDSKMSRKIMRRVIPARPDYELVEADSGKRALEMVAAEPFDVMFLDLTMPELDGYQVLEALRDVPNRPRVVVVSGDVQKLGQERVKRLGAWSFLCKPVQAELVTGALKEMGLL
jgi:CheY-like chemotaxis protein